MKRITDDNLEAIAICHQIMTTLFGESGRLYVLCITKVGETGLVSSPLFPDSSDGRWGEDLADRVSNLLLPCFFFNVNVLSIQSVTFGSDLILWDWSIALVILVGNR
jgi:hypothetical protein